MTIPARYSGTCPDCGGRWQPGDLIRSHVDTPGQSGYWQSGYWAHASCPDDDPLAVDNPVCPVCWLTHPAGACDR